VNSARWPSGNQARPVIETIAEKEGLIATEKDLTIALLSS